MSGALQWSGTNLADRFVFDNDYDRLDFVIAGQGDDFISDGSDDSYWSSDVFCGQKGNDTLVSSDGNDVLHGGRGDDVFEVRLGWYDPADIQFPPPGIEHGQIGFEVEVFGGHGHDVLIISNSAGYTIEHVGDDVIIHSVFGGTVTVHDVEEFQFV